MRKIFFLIAFSICSNLFSQDFTKITVETNFVSTSKMIWDFKNEKWSFSSNEDLSRYKTLWAFNLRSDGTGLISNGSVNYDVISLENSKSLAGAYVLNVYNVNLRRRMLMVLAKSEERSIISIFDEESRTSYYFFQ
jgi:hypothetical protein